MQLTGLGLWPEQNSAKVNKSLNDLISGLLAIPQIRVGERHGSCGFYLSLKADVRKIADLSLPTESLQDCEEYMALQKAK